MAWWHHCTYSHSIPSAPRKPTMTRCAHSKLTASARWLELAAIRLDMESEQSLPSWVFLGQTHRYIDNKIKSAALRHAAGIKNISERRQYLRNNGVSA